jgi:hypothetical protein
LNNVLTSKILEEKGEKKKKNKNYHMIFLFFLLFFLLTGVTQLKHCFVQVIELDWNVKINCLSTQKSQPHQLGKRTIRASLVTVEG